MSLADNTLFEKPATREKQHVILFYKYHPLSTDASVTKQYRAALETLCSSLHLTGRILVAQSENEGINGTLAGSYGEVKAFTNAITGQELEDDEQDDDTSNAVNAFKRASQAFFQSLGLPELTMTPEEFKWSTSTSSNPLFPDLNVKLVKELIGTGGVLESIPISETAKGYITPKEWHEQMLALGNTEKDDTVVIDCRNAKEHAIGHFPTALDPKTNTFSQFGRWVHDNEHILADKKVLMYCTGGIRCEKASAYIRRQIPSVKDVRHLKGGIHKYLEEFGGSGTWKGRNFVFDNRIATSAEETRLGQGQDVVVPAGLGLKDQDDTVGSCSYCSQPYDEFHPVCVCTVCREPLLVCFKCQKNVDEYHCRQHFHLKDYYFTNLDRFSKSDLEWQAQGLARALAEIGIGRKFKQKRKTLQKQIDRVLQQLARQSNSANLPTDAIASKCRHCGDNSCTSECWGFHGLKRKQVIEERRSQDDDSARARSIEKKSRIAPNMTRPKQPTKKELLIDEINSLGLSKPPNVYRDEATGIRVPPCCVRVLRCYTKPKWCGRPILKVLNDEFVDMSKPQTVKNILDNKLLRLNGKPVDAMNASQVLLKDGDLISRLVHWHEAPVIVPDRLMVEKSILAPGVINEYHLEADCCVYVCNKPSTVPVHPAGPYISNSLSMMVEAQEGLPPASLIPLHRTDRVTSGLVLMCTNPQVSRIFQRAFSEAGSVRKLYLAAVKGRFWSCADDFKDVVTSERAGTITCDGTRSSASVEVAVSAAVETIDPANGIRAITEKGKPAKSLFRLLEYDSETDTSYVACYPVTGRNHQLRVHLSWLGFPIIGDVQYGGPANDSALKDSILSLMEKTPSQSVARLPELTDEDVDAARLSCFCYDGGRESTLEAFTPAQLLLRGHSIRLHALKYQVDLMGAKKRGESIATVEFTVPRPSWASKLDSDSISWFV